MLSVQVCSGSSSKYHSLSKSLTAIFNNAASLLSSRLAVDDVAMATTKIAHAYPTMQSVVRFMRMRRYACVFIHVSARKLGRVNKNIVLK